MKKYIVIILASLLSAANIAFSQCTPPGVKIQTPLCEIPSNLKTGFPNCSAVRMAWKGHQEQNYILQASLADSAGSRVFEIRVNNDSCDKAGNCAVTMGIVPGTTVNWNVQAECSINNTLVYSNKLPMQNGVAPFCKAETSISNKEAAKEQTIQVYPNPSTGYLNVNYSVPAQETIRFSVFDMSGKMVFQKLNDKAGASDNIQLNLKHLSPGSYVLQCTAGQYASETKFVLIRN